MPDTDESSSAASEREQGLPRHVGIIMDGNGRWAKERHLPRNFGHRAGVDAIRPVLEAAAERGIPMLSIYAFSTENWQRPQEEVSHLMRLFWEYTQRELNNLHRNGVRLRHLGRRDRLPADLLRRVDEAIELTKDNTRIDLNICMNYGGRSEVVDAVRELMAAGLRPEDVTEQSISDAIYSRGLPDPDLIIRTAGEMRLSNFLLWQSAYSEYYSTETFWPDFDKAEFNRAIDAYMGRHRRFGKV